MIFIIQQKVILSKSWELQINPIFVKIILCCLFIFLNFLKIFEIYESKRPGIESAINFNY